MVREWKWMSLVAGLAFGVGCAHQAPVAKSTAGHPEVVAQAAPAVANDSEADRQAAELAKLLKGTVAHFEFDRDALTDEGQARLRTVADALRKLPKAKIRVSGHADELGTEEYNLALGQRRAEVAKKYLVALGVEQVRVDTVSYGEEKPAAAGHADSDHAANRRDELEPLSK